MVTVPQLRILKMNAEDEVLETFYSLPVTDNSEKLKEREQRKQNDEEEKQCSICEIPFKRSEIKKHTRTAEHKHAVREASKKETAPEAAKAQQEQRKNHFKEENKESFHFRLGYDQRNEENLIFQSTLTTFLCLCFCLDDEIKDVRIAMNDAKWKDFGDIVFETINQQDIMELYAIQCKKVSGNILPNLMKQSGKFSLTQQCDTLEKLMKKKEVKTYDKTNFILLTESKLHINVDAKYSIEKLGNEKWKNRKFVVVNLEKKHPISTTEETENAISFKLCGDDDNTKEINNKLMKFVFLHSQKKTKDLRDFIQWKLDNKFKTTRDITPELIKFINGYYFKSCKRQLKLSKKYVLMKIAQLLLSPYVKFPEPAVENKKIEDWDKAVTEFDVTVVNKSAINVIYGSINRKLEENIDSLNVSQKTVKISKDSIKNSVLKLEMFSYCSEGVSRDFPLNKLYVMMWKAKLAPLVLLAEEDETVRWMLKIFTILKKSNVSTNFVLLTDSTFDFTFVENLTVFSCMEDIKRNHEKWYQSLVKEIQIPVLNFKVSLGEIVELNEDFLRLIKPEVFINMILGDFSFKEAPKSELCREIPCCTIVFQSEIIRKFRTYFPKADTVKKSDEFLGTTVFVDGRVQYLKIEPDI